MKNRFLKIVSSFLAIILVLGQFVTVSAYDEEINKSTNISGAQQGKIKDSNFVLLTNDLSGKSAKVYQQYVELTEEQFNNINNKIKELNNYVNEHDEATEENVNNMNKLDKEVDKLVPIFNNEKWTELTLTEANAIITRNNIQVQGDKYNVPLPDNIAYMVSWTKVVVGDTEYYQYFLYCYEEKITVTYKCDYVDGKYYNKSGKEVSKEEYEEDCSNKSCTIKDGKYYGLDAEEVDEKTYKEQCGKYCKVVDGKYYNDKGEEVNKATYEKACGNPKTGNTNYYLIGGTFIAISALGYALIRDKKLLSKKDS